MCGIAGWAGTMRARCALRPPQGEMAVQADAIVLALGGGSRARLGSDGAWVSFPAQRGVEVALAAVELRL